MYVYVNFNEAQPPQPQGWVPQALLGAILGAAITLALMAAKKEHFSVPGEPSPGLPAPGGPREDAAPAVPPPLPGGAGRVE